MKRFFAIMLMLAMIFSLCACATERAAETRKKSSEKDNESVTESLNEQPTGQGGTIESTQPASGPAVTQPGTQATGEATMAPATPGTATTEATTGATTEATTKPVQQPEQPTHSSMYISGIGQDDVVRWFNEVCLDAEFVNAGNATLVQKWSSGISYALLGAPTEEDKAAVASMASFMNGISGFPGMYEVADPNSASLKINFVSEDEMINILGTNFYGCDGGVTFWYNGNNAIYKGEICIRTDLDQYVRNSVIKEEIYNGMGPIQDTDLRSDSLIWSGYSTPQHPSSVDRLIMSLLYNPQIRCGMNITECDKIIRQLYY